MSDMPLGLAIGIPCGLAIGMNSGKNAAIKEIALNISNFINEKQIKLVDSIGNEVPLASLLEFIKK